MADTYGSPFLSYAAIATGASFAGLKTAANANITVLINALTPSKTVPVSMPLPEFDQIPPVVAAIIAAELVAIQATITNAT